MPGDDGLGPRVRDNNDGTIVVEYQPKVEGRHEVLMTHNGNAVKGKHDVIMHFLHHSHSHVHVVHKGLFVDVL
jgi:hypothetical protein